MVGGLAEGMGIGTDGLDEPIPVTVVFPVKEAVRVSPPNEASRGNAGVFGGILVSGCNADLPDCRVLFMIIGEFCCTEEIKTD